MDARETTLTMWVAAGILRERNLGHACEKSGEAEDDSKKCCAEELHDEH
jgi:hypothetical protein